MKPEQVALGRKALASGCEKGFFAGNYFRRQTVPFLFRPRIPCSPLTGLR